MNPDYGKRDLTTNRKRMVALALLACIVLFLEATLGHELDRLRVAQIFQDGAGWAHGIYRGGDEARSPPPQKGDEKRIVYISNSHARTGGYVPRHLQRLLNRAAPGKFDVLDMADAGIFAPDMLQRSLKALEFKPDAVVLGVSYISFSDRMRMPLQAHTVRSFFNNGITERLSPGFWARHYDIGLYSNELVADWSALYRNRNALRNLWERPGARLLRQVTGERKRVNFLEVDESGRWRFPEGYDRNLFQWRLYATERDGHLADVRELAAALEGKTEILAFNTPIDFRKSLYEHNPRDYAKYRRQIREIFQDKADYFDCEDYFPKQFSTYDALHPTWHGARLHAFDIALRLSTKMPGLTEAALLDAVKADQNEDERRYTQAIEEIPDKRAKGFRRFEISEPKNAKSLLQRLHNAAVETRRHQGFVANLAWRIDYWTNGKFPIPTRDRASKLWKSVVVSEIEQARMRADQFKERLVELESRRLKAWPLPKVTAQSPDKKRRVNLGEKGTVSITTYRLPKQKEVVTIQSKKGDLIGAGNRSVKDKKAYMRIDLLEDGSLILLRPFGRVTFPRWYLKETPAPNWGI